MRTMRVNALSVFLAIKYASTAMMKADPVKGKGEEGGSIILTASGMSICLSFRPLFLDWLTCSGNSRGNEIRSWPDGL